MMLDEVGARVDEAALCRCCVTEVCNGLTTCFPFVFRCDLQGVRVKSTKRGAHTTTRVDTSTPAVQKSPAPPRRGKSRPQPDDGPPAVPHTPFDWKGRVLTVAVLPGLA